MSKKKPVPDAAPEPEADFDPSLPPPPEAVPARPAGFQEYPRMIYRKLVRKSDGAVKVEQKVVQSEAELKKVMSADKRWKLTPPALDPETEEEGFA